MSGKGLSDLLFRPAVSVGGDSLDTLDLVLLGVLSGEWVEFEREIARGVALERAHGQMVSQEEVRTQATLFRYERGLISAADFRQWLAQRDLTVSDVSGVLGRLILRRRFDGPGDPPSDREQTITVVRAEALCDGILSRLAQTAIRLLSANQLVSGAGGAPAPDAERTTQAVSTAHALDALAIATPEPEELRRRISVLLSLELSAQRLRLDVGQPAAVAGRIRDHALDWLALCGRRLTFQQEGAAREARLLLRDGETAEEVSERSGAPVLDHRVLVSDAPGGLAGFFASAAVGEVVGPWEQDGHWHVMQVLDKSAPSPEEDPVRERAVDELWSEAVDRHAAGRTARHVAL